MESRTDGKRITQADVARRLGVTQAAVSMAFRNHPRISREVRDRIRAEAEQLGYVPDPMMTALAAYRNRLRPANYQGVLAWLGHERPPHDWRHNKHFTAFFEGARRTAMRHGFQLEAFDTGKRDRRHLRKAASVLRARNIAGILVAPQPVPGADLSDFPWEDFVAVALGYTLGAPRLHVVAAAQFQATVECVRQLRETGHRRIGFVLTRDHVERTRRQYLGAYMAEQEMAGLTGQIPVLMLQQPDPASLKSWLKKHRPDAIIGSGYLGGRLERLGWRVPEAISLACPNLPDENSGVSGVWEMPLDSGGAAADLLVSMLHRGERGVPGTPQTVLVGGRWVAGKTLKAR
jgi:DNA-binding LacI/PurR family transcriptional regulator